MKRDEARSRLPLCIALLKEKDRQNEWFQLQMQTIFGDGIEALCFHEGSKSIGFYKGLPKLADILGIETHESINTEYGYKILTAEIDGIELRQMDITGEGYR